MKTGTKVIVLHGGIGCLLADDTVGVVIDKPELRPDNYHGEYWESVAPLYVQCEATGNVYGLCTGFKVKKLKS